MTLIAFITKIGGDVPANLRQLGQPLRKLLTCAAVALADITSANIVGYNTVNINKEYTLLTINFQKPDGTDIPLQEAFPAKDGMTCAQADTTADNIQVMNDDGGYSIYFLSNGHYGPNGRFFDENLTNKWANVESATTVSEDTLPVGTTFWYLSRGAAAGNNHTLTVAGAVDLAENESYILNKEYTLIGCPFPAAVAINGGIELTGETCAQADTTADNIQVMKDDGGYSIYFLSNGHYGPNGRFFDENLTNKWANVESATTATTDTFPVGGGAWYLSRSQNGTIKFINPLK